MNKRFVYAVRIWNKDGHQPMADLALGDGGRPSGEIETIRWDDNQARSEYVINAYTLMFDERTDDFWESFEDYINCSIFR